MSPFLLSPGPTPLSSDVLQALSQPPIHHRSQTFKDLLKECIELLTLLLDGPYRLGFQATGTGAMEACVSNFLNINGTALCLNGGKFGERWGKITQAYKVPTVVHKFEWGHTPNLNQVTEILKSHKPQALFTQACETSTGTIYDIPALADLIHTHSPDTLLIVDGITAVGAFPFSMTQARVDVLITGSQKALGLPTGLSFMGLSEKAYRALPKSDFPKFYFDVSTELKSLKKGQTTFSASTPLWSAAHMELKKLSEKNELQKKYNQNKRLQTLIHNWAKKNGLELFSKSPSPSLTALILPDALSATTVQKALLSKGYFVATGQDKFKDRLIRIGHMANVSDTDMGCFLKAFKEVL